MKNTVYIPNFVDFLERKCVNIIKEQVDIFFNGCFKSLNAYSVLVSNNLKMHNKENFESMVLSIEEINSFINKVQKMLVLEIESAANEYVDIELNVKVNHLNLDNIKDFVDCLYITNELTKVSEKLINNSFYGLVGTLTKNVVINYLFDKIDFAEFLMGGASTKKSVKENQERIYRKIEGILVNVKNDIYNQLVGQAIKIIDELFCKEYKEEKYKTA